MEPAGLTRQQRREHTSLEIGRVSVALFVLILAIVALSGCAMTLDRSIATCAGLDGSWNYTKGGDMEKFSCDRPAIVTRAAR